MLVCLRIAIIYACSYISKRLLYIKSNNQYVYQCIEFIVYKMEKHVRVVLIVFIFNIGCCLSPQQQKKADIQQSQIEYRDNIGLNYGQNTETITFAIRQATDFVIKTLETQQIRGTMHTYWKQENVYISSEYREGQNVRIVIYEDKNIIIEDRKFYVASGFKFQAEKGRIYTIRLMNEGNIEKLMAMQISHSLSSFEKTATLAQYEELSNKISNIGQQVKSLLTISQWSDILHEKNSVSTNHSICLYMTYLMIEATLVLVIVSLQVKYMKKMLAQDSIV